MHFVKDDARRDRRIERFGVGGHWNMDTGSGHLPRFGSGTMRFPADDDHRRAQPINGVVWDFPIRFSHIGVQLTVMQSNFGPACLDDRQPEMGAHAAT